MDWKSTTLISGAGVLATWVFSMPPAAPPAANPASAVAPRPSPQALDIQREAARLQIRLHPDPRPVAPSRNPFQFATRASEVAPQAAPEAPAAVVAPLPQPAFSLDGVATDMVDGQEQHTAILHTDEGIVLVKEGDIVSGQYRVMSVGSAAAELQNVGSGSVLRLVLR